MEAVVSGNRGDKKDPGAQRTFLGRERDGAKFQWKASGARWGEGQKIRLGNGAETSSLVCLRQSWFTPIVPA